MIESAKCGEPLAGERSEHKITVEDFRGVKDWDFAVEADSYGAMREWMVAQGFEIFVETPQYFTIRARTPKQGFIFNGIDMSHKTFDFALCRVEAKYSDGRRPDLVSVGTIRSDLSRRDFTMNAIALAEDGRLIDPYDGVLDIQRGLIRCVGGVERLEEDSLRMIRALRFAVQLDFGLSTSIQEFLSKPKNAELLDNISEERISEELKKMFKIDTWTTLEVLSEYRHLLFKIFEGDLWLLPTVKGTGNDKKKAPKALCTGMGYRA